MPPFLETNGSGMVLFENNLQVLEKWYSFNADSFAIFV